GQWPPEPVSDASQVQRYATLAGLIREAYRLESYQELLGPSWIDTTRFEVTAKPPDGASRDQIPAMLQDLLTERFKLVVRRESKEQTVYFLTAAKDGLRLTEVAPDEPKKPWKRADSTQTALYRISTPDGWVTYSVLNGHYSLEANKITMAELASFLRP